MTSVALIAFTRKGCLLAKDIVRGLAAMPAFATATFSVCGPAKFAADVGIDAYDSLASWTAQHFAADDALVFVGASGIAVRAIAPHVRDKFSDPAVVSVDEGGNFAVPLLSGHVGGANELARHVAHVVGGQAAVSTATDVNGLFAVDEWAARKGLAIVEREIAKEVSASLLEGKPVGFQVDCEGDWDVPAIVQGGPADVGFIISLDDTAQPFERTLHLVPRIVTVGVGCRQGIPFEVLERAVDAALDSARISRHAVRAVASIDVKSGEPAILRLAESRGWDALFYTAEELAAVPGDFPSSDFVKRTVGVGNVCERAACAGGGELVVGKRSADGTTVAVAVFK